MLKTAAKGALSWLFYQSEREREREQPDAMMTSPSGFSLMGLWAPEAHRDVDIDT